MDDVAAEAGVTKLIVYRHFDGKEDLYRSVLDSVNGRLVAEFEHRPAARGATLSALLRVARDDPAGFRLLMLHAPREPQFTEHLLAYRRSAIAAADRLIGESFGDDVVRAWADRMVIDHLVSAIVNWLDVGEESRDDDFVERATRGLIALFDSWRT